MRKYQTSIFRSNIENLNLLSPNIVLFSQWFPFEKNKNLFQMAVLSKKYLFDNTINHNTITFFDYCKLV